MSYYDNQQWPASGQPTWEQQTPPARSGASSAVPREETGAFMTQIEEVDRAIDNLAKSGKMFPNMPGPGRRESMPLAGGPPRPFSEQYDPRMGGGPQRHHSVSGDFGDARSFSGSNLQNFYANQRHAPSRGANEVEQVMQAKRRMAAQRERELRNYHQEQQYNRSVSAEISTIGGKQLDRTMSPGSGMSEDERRELIARQRNALYGEGAAYNENGGFDENGTPRPGTQGSGSQSASGIRGHSPLAFDHYNSQNQGENQSQAQTEQPQSAVGQGQGQQRSRANSTSSPSSNPTSSFSLFESAAQQSSRTSTSSPGESPPRQGKGPTSSGVAPIGTRPSGQAPNPALNKRSTTPLPSPLSYGFAASNEDNQGEKEGRTASAASNSNSQNQQDVGLGWGSKSGVWGKNSSLGVQASVWG
ncbi:hypothetical protein IFR04_014561 [Cadophora malorum]|uniref:Uncharacterized protein n=1 Tax=Cadophora malorum TaxID=108018 RepID=A0A8H7W235_9HELO|nr:hypothetical protein IFR04_014561 [Cadophora malorum]